MPLSKAAWMDARAIARARRIFEATLYHAEGMNADTERVAAEGLACLEDAQPEYLTNLIRQDHPDRVAALALLVDMWEER